MKKKIMAEIVATTSLPVDHLTATDCNAAAPAIVNHPVPVIGKGQEDLNIHFCAVL